MRASLSVAWLLVGCLAIAMAADLLPRIDTVLQNRRLFKSFADCLLDRGNCSPEGRTVKRMLPRYIETNCKRCLPEVKLSACKVIKFLGQDGQEELWEAFLAKYDPRKVYRHNVDGFLKDCKTLMT